MKRTYFNGTDQEQIDNLRQDNDRLRMTVTRLMYDYYCNAC